jgi:hypothetical protein
MMRVCLATVASLSAALAGAACATPAAPPATGDDGGVAGDGAAGGCPPRAVTAPAITWIPPHPLHSNACTPSDAAAIVSCILDGQSCNVLVTVACRTCAVSGDTTPSSAALIVHDQSAGRAPELNIAGCVGAASGDPSLAGCGAKLAAKDACIASACAGCTAPADAQSCSTQATATVCAAASADAQCATPYLAQCVQGANQGEIAFNLVKVFCGP